MTESFICLSVGSSNQMTLYESTKAKPPAATVMLKVSTHIGRLLACWCMMLFYEGNLWCLIVSIFRFCAPQLLAVVITLATLVVPQRMLIGLTILWLPITLCLQWGQIVLQVKPKWTQKINCHCKVKAVLNDFWPQDGVESTKSVCKQTVSHRQSLTFTLGGNWCQYTVQLLCGM